MLNSGTPNNLIPTSVACKIQITQKERAAVSVPYPYFVGTLLTLYRRFSQLKPFNFKLKETDIL